MLAVATTGILAAMTRSELATRTWTADDHAARSIEALLAADMTHAHHFKVLPDGFAVQSTAHLEAGTLRLDHLPTVVTYQVRQVNQKPCLFRRQVCAVEPAWTELAAAGVRTVRLVPARDVQAGADGWKSLTTKVVVRVERAGDDPAKTTVLEIAVPEKRVN